MLSEFYTHIVWSLVVHLSVCVLFVAPYTPLSTSVLTCSVKHRRPPQPWSPLQAASCTLWTHMLCHHWLCRWIPVPVLTLSNYYKNSLMRRLWVLSWGTFICYGTWNICYTHSFLLFCFFFNFFSHLAPTSLPLSLYPPSLPLTAPLPSPSPHSLVSGWEVHGGCGISEGQWGFASYQSTVCVEIRVFFSACVIAQQRMPNSWCCLLAWLKGP